MHACIAGAVLAFFGLLCSGGEVQPYAASCCQMRSISLFVSLQVDAAHVSDGQDMEATREYVADLVTRQMGCEGFQLRPEQVR
jgi:hypothetical protein